MKRFISRLISKEADKDPQKQEWSNLLKPNQIALAVFNEFDMILSDLVDNIHEGEILSDSRGEGTLQQRDGLNDRG